MSYQPLSLFEKRQLAKFSPEDLLHHLAQHNAFLPILRDWVEWLRQGGEEKAQDRLSALVEVMPKAPEARDAIGRHFHEWLQSLHAYASFVNVGIFARHGIWHETRTLLYERLNPLPVDEKQLHDVLEHVFHGQKDLAWLAALSPRTWLHVFEQLSQDSEQKQRTKALLREECLYTLEMLAIRLSAEDLTPDLIRLDKRLLELDSPFIALQRELDTFITQWREQPDNIVTPEDLSHAMVLIEQAEQQLDHLHSRAISYGSSLATAYLLERLQQSLQRLKNLLALLVAQTPENEARHWLGLIRDLLQNGLKQRRIGHLWRKSAFLLSQSITQHKSHHGEHYIASDTQGLRKMFLGAAGGGVIIAFMAWIKLYLGTLNLHLNTYTLLSSLNYGLGFVLIYLCGFSVATKQPAMTASYLAEAIEKSEHGRASGRKLAQLLLDVHRSQSYAVLGNITLAMSVAALFSWGYASWTDKALLSQKVAYAQIHSLDLPSALFYASIAAVWLCFSGVITGYFDNRARYLRLNERLRVNPLLMRVLSEKRRLQFAEFMHHNLGAIYSNLCFGFLLGFTPWLGKILGLPLDIRHIAFSSANLAYASASQHLGWGLFLGGLLSVLMIGLVNLWVSFYLALNIALRARESTLPPMKPFLAILWEEIRKNPKALFLPTKR
ncbi:MAG: recombinase [Cardiobacteriaceae bacterium]|nr:recombinase [Cardiobacteriaceae bacterium]